jgi:hypothetical protein
MKLMEAKLTKLITENGAERTAGDRDSGILIPSHGHGQLRPWRPGQSGNPGGVGGQLREAQRLAKQSTPKAIRRLIDMLDSKDDRVVVVAANALWDKAGGKVMENNPEQETGKRIDLSKLTAPELQFLLKLVRSGAMQMTEAPSVTLEGEVIEADAQAG